MYKNNICTSSTQSSKFSNAITYFSSYIVINRECNTSSYLKHVQISYSYITNLFFFFFCSFRPMACYSSASLHLFTVDLGFSSLHGSRHVLSLPVDVQPFSICACSILFFSFVPTMLWFGSHMFPVYFRFSFYPSLFCL